MFLRINQYLFGSLLFAFKIAFLGASIFFVLQSVVFVFASNFYDGIGLSFLISLYVLLYCFVSSYLVFLLSVVLKNIQRPLPYEDYAYLLLAALPINVFVMIGGAAMFGAQIGVPIASAFTVYFGSRIYRKTWATLSDLLNQTAS